MNQCLLPATANVIDEPLELLIVEGQSALHAIDAVRRRRNQALLSMQGKIPNLTSRSKERILSHEHINRLISALGTGVEPDCDPDKLKFHRIRVIAEADADGQHAAWLLLQFFRVYLTPLMATGVLGVIQAPLARIDAPTTGARYLWNDNEKRRYLDCRDAADTGTITVFKGIASLSAADRHYWLVDPSTRREQVLDNGNDFA